MSSTYSDNLKIELIGSGEQAGNWGSTTNTNLGTLIEQAIAGYTSYPCSGGTDTLPMTQGATATARNMYIRLYGTGGGVVEVPALTKLYFIYNNTTSGAVTVRVNGQTGVSVPNGAKVCLLNNGTDIVVADNYMVSPTLSNATLTGTPIAPTASAGTSTTQIATTAFVSAALAAAYPIGSIYMATVSTSPATLLGFGTWVRYGQGRMPISADDSTYTIGGTGGSATTTLSTANLPSHNHSATSVVTDPGHFHTYNYGSTNASNVSLNDIPFWYGRSVTQVNSAVTGITVGTTIGSTGSGTAATTISPYIVVYMWNRTA
jgi:hypothetical protein